MTRISFTRLWQTKVFRFALLFVAATVVCTALVGARRVRAASSTSGTLTTANTQSNPLHFTGGPFYTGNQTGFNSALGGLRCSPAQAFPCEDYALTVSLPDGLLDTKQVHVQVSWPDPNADFDIFIMQNGVVVNNNGATSADPENALLPAKSDTYLVRIIPFAPIGQSYDAKIWLEDKPTQ